MIEIIYLILIILAAFALGRKIFSIFKIKFHSPLEEFLFSIAIGYAILAYSTFIIGLTGFLYPLLFNMLFLILIIFLFPTIKNFLFELAKKLRKLKPRFSLYWSFIAILSLIALLNLFASLAPPFIWDTTVVHMAIPKIYMQNHKIVYIPYMIYSEWPIFTSILFLFGMLLKNPILSQLISFSFGLFLALSIYSFVKKHFSKLAAIMAALIFYTIPIIEHQSPLALEDIPLAFYAFMAIYAFYYWFDSPERLSYRQSKTGGNRFFSRLVLPFDKRWLVISALMAGIAASIKVFGPIFAIVSLLFIIYKSILAKKNKTTALRTIAIFGIISFLAVMPWYLKSYINAGNPVYPFMYGVFGGQNWSSHNSDLLYSHIKEFGGKGSSFAMLLRLPWDLTMRGIIYDGIIGITPIFLAFIPLYIFIKKNRLVNLLLAYSLIYLIFWFYFISQNTRFLIPILPLLSIISAYVISSLIAQKFFYKKILFILFIGLMFNLALWLGSNAKQLPVAFGLESEKDFYNELKDWNNYDNFQYMNNNLPKNSRLFLFGILRGYLSDLDYVWGDPIFQAYVDYNKLKNGDDLFNRLKEIGITHIVDFRYKIDTKIVYTKRITDMMDDMIKKHAELAYKNGDFHLYKLIAD